MTVRNPDLQQRIRTAGILIAGILVIGVASLYFCFFHWLLFDLALLAVILSAWEYVSFSQPTGTLPRKSVATLGLTLPSFFVAYGVSVLGICDRVGGYTPLLELAVIGFLFSFVATAIGRLRSAHMTIAEISRGFGEQLVALVFIGFSATFLLILAAEPKAFLGIAWFISVVALNDSIAYFAGRRFGSRPVASQVSPKKTVEGSLSGLLGGMIAGGVLGLGLLPESSFTHSLFLAAFVVVAAQMGDLIKSLLKRLHNTKDSGTILPGHGGVLDRIDGLIGAAPFFYLLRDWFTG